MRQKRGYKGKELPSTIYVVTTGDEFRMYVYEQQALRWLNKNLTENKPAKLQAYVKENVKG